MRPKERIYKYLTLFLNNLDKTDLNDAEKQAIRDNKKTIFKYWKENPDQRIGQMMFNLFNFSKFNGGKIYYLECYDYLAELGIPKRDLVLWGSYGKEQNKPLQYIWLSDMEDDHIINILKTQNNLKPDYKTVFEEELKNRGLSSFNNEPKFGNTKGKITLVNDIIYDDNFNDILGKVGLDKFYIEVIVEMLEAYELDLYVDYSKDGASDFYIEIPDDIEKDILKNLFIGIGNLDYDVLEEVTLNVLKISWK